jgi:photolyase PhrII
MNRDVSLLSLSPCEDPLAEGLPEHLRERVRLLAGRSSDRAARVSARDGELVLYWMHHAARGHENPALDVARLLAEAIGLPLLVYQGLAGRHRYNADRHHAFILEGARDAHAELEVLGVRAVFHLPSDPGAPSPLIELARRSALVVTEDFPAPPFPRWSQRLAERSGAPVWLVDSACIVPMQLQPRRFERAFELRRHNEAAYAERVARPWPAVEAWPARFDGGLPFAPIDLGRADLAAVIADCAIDHSLPAVPHTPGGSQAGYRRWEQFRREGLPTYHRRRNDAAQPWPLGVSRLSPYLHHGQVSPFRIAREASADAGKGAGEGAEKFLDELLIWRELAHNLCFYADEVETLSILPEWARETLAAHRDDARERLLDPETLARGQSGDRLWDLAQTSLLVHGELHNNLRMTWAKAIPHWRPDPAAALATLIDLNHRHALDGCDPNSYGGLLWTLGLFDRPFDPEKPVIGRLRGRPTAAHAERLDLDAYARRVTAPAVAQPLRIAVIGAGLSGLAAARILTDQRHQVVVFEKSRGCGGRAATRRAAPSGAPAFGVDHGAQYFTARDPRFLRRVQSWSEQGLVAPWSGRIGAFNGERLTPAGQDTERWVGVPGMSALGRGLAAGLDLRFETKVVPPRRVGREWLLADEQGRTLGRFDRVVISAPAPQAAELLSAAPRLAAQAACVDYTPCWTLMIALAADTEVPFDGVFVNWGPLRWVARNRSKPGRSAPGQPETWVLQADPGWSKKHLDAPRERVEAALLEAFATVTGIANADPIWQQSHSWLYSLVDSPLESGCLWDAGVGIGACGDWCNGARIEGAWLSGEAVAGRLLADAARARG